MIARYLPVSETDRMTVNQHIHGSFGYARSVERKVETAARQCLRGSRTWYHNESAYTAVLYLLVNSDSILGTAGTTGTDSDVFMKKVVHYILDKLRVRIVPERTSRVSYEILQDIWTYEMVRHFSLGHVQTLTLILSREVVSAFLVVAGMYRFIHQPGAIRITAEDLSAWGDISRLVLRRIFGHDSPDATDPVPVTIPHQTAIDLVKLLIHFAFEFTPCGFDEASLFSLGFDAFETHNHLWTTLLREMNDASLSDLVRQQQAATRGHSNSKLWERVQKRLLQSMILRLH